MLGPKDGFITFFLHQYPIYYQAGIICLVLYQQTGVIGLSSNVCTYLIHKYLTEGSENMVKIGAM